MIVKVLFIVASLLLYNIGNGQKIITLDEIIHIIESGNPLTKMYDAQIRSMDEAAEGAKSWMPAEFGTGLWMTPYNLRLWQKSNNGSPGMGQYMFSAQQMFPNKKKQNAEAAYMKGIAASEKETKKYALNQLYADARKNYYEWVIIKKKISILNEDEKLLNFMIRDAEIRYKNGLDRLSAYYKAKAESGNIANMKVEFENQVSQKRIALNTLMNRDKTTQFDIDTVYAIKDFNAPDTASLSEKSDIRAIDEAIHLTYLKQQVEKLKIKPEFGVEYDHMFGFGGLPMQYSLMARATIPIGRANRTSKANVESLKWKSEALAQQRLMLLNETSGRVAGTGKAIEAKKKQIRLFEKSIIPALQRNYQVIQLGYQQNMEQLFTLFDAWQTLNKTQLEYLDQLQQLLTLQTEMERILEVK